MSYASVKFKWQKDDKTYDYVVPDGMDLSPGDRVVVKTRRGETEVEIVSIEDESEMATATILRKAEPKQPDVKEEMDF